MQYEELIHRIAKVARNLATFIFARNETTPLEVEVIATKFSCLSRKTGHTPLIFQPHLPHTTLNSLQPLHGLSHS